MSPILTAEGIVIRAGPRPLIGIVQRRKDKAWVLPKRKLKRRESALAAARREVAEETGHTAFVHEFLGAISYQAGGRSKLVQFWCMQARAEAGRKPARDIKAVAWLPLEAAIEQLSLPLEQVFLRSMGPRALKRLRAAGRPTRPARPVRRHRPVRARPAPSVVEEPASLPANINPPPARRGFLHFILNAFGGR